MKPENTPSPSLFPTTQIRQCPALNSSTTFALPTKNDELVNELLAFLNAGGMWEDLGTIFNQAEYEYWLDITKMDFDHDMTDEIAVVGAVPHDLDHETQTKIYIFRCTHFSYELWTSYKLSTISGAVIIGQEQLFPLPYAQLIIKYPHDFAFLDYYMGFGWDGKKWMQYFNIPIGIVSEIILFDQDGDNIKEIALIGGTGGGFSRQVIAYFKWHLHEYVFEKNVFLPSPFRIHYLQDAQNALDQGDIPFAITLYETAAYGQSLLDAPSTHEIITNQADKAGSYQQAFALFRLSSLWLKLGRFDQAQKIIDEMTKRYSSGTPGSELTEAIMILQERFDAGDDPKSACGFVTDYLRDNYPNLAGYEGHLGYWGVTNVSYEIEDICPFR